MSSKKIICTVIALASYLLFTGFAPDCDAQLTLDVNSSLDEYSQDLAYCAENATTSGLCYGEADASFNYSINQDLKAHHKCCCKNNLPCCD
jgi:hypothetical protein